MSPVLFLKWTSNRSELYDYNPSGDLLRNSTRKLEFGEEIEVNNKMDLLNHLDKIHTTELGVIRIRKNLSLDVADVVDWCKTKINSANAIITRNGKNWYVNVDNCVITINAHSYTIITAHKEKK